MLGLARSVLALSLLAAVVVAPACGGARGGAAGVGNVGASTLTLAPATVQVGDRRTKVDSLTTRFTVTSDGQQVPIESNETSTETAEVLAVDAAGAPTKLRITYTTKVATQAVAGQVDVAPQPLEGRTYVVWVEAGVVRATSGDGEPVTEAELAALADDHETLGRPAAMERILAGRTWRLGERYSLTEAELAEYNELKRTASGQHASAMALTLTGFDDQLATFEMEVTLRTAKGGAALTISMTGPVRIERARTRPLEITMTGTLEGVTQGLPAVGTVEGHTTFAY
ncbi:MAG: hypothetical protein R2939_01410 [Kofleriaceae bacterium]